MDYYAILGIEQTASHADVRTAYLQMAFRYHPDKNITENKDAEIRFKLVQEAYDVLSSSDKRSKYDATYRNPSMQPILSEYDVIVDSAGLSIHTMEIHQLPHIDCAFQNDISGRV